MNKKLKNSDEKNSVEKINLNKYINDFYKKLNLEKNALANEFNIPVSKEISRMKLNKILYFMYGYFWKEFEKELYDANFEAWKCGPIEVNYESVETILLNKKELEKIKHFSKNLLSYSTWYLIEQSQLTSPWERNFTISEKGKCLKTKISNEDIKKFFMEN